MRKEGGPGSNFYIKPQPNPQKVINELKRKDPTVGENIMACMARLQNDQLIVQNYYNQDIKP